MEPFIFMQTIKNADGALELHALASQQATDYSGDIHNLNPDFPIKVDKQRVTAYSEGTFFGVVREFFFITDKNGGSNDESPYAVGTSFPLVNEFQLADDSHKPSEEMMNAFKNFKSKYNLDSAPKAAPAAAPGRTAKTTEAKSFFDILDARHPCPSISTTKFFIRPEHWRILVRNVLKGKNTLLFGPSGCGKTALVKAIGKSLGLPVTVIHANTITDPEQLTGTLRMEAGGNVYFDYAEFAQAIQRPGIVLLDEINRANSTVTNALLGVLDDGRSLMVSMAGGKEKRSIPVHKDCSFLATANIGAQFVGTYKIDPALMSRMFPFQLNHPDSWEEENILTALFKISSEKIGSIVKIANEIRKSYAVKNIHQDISTRETIELAELVSDGLSVKDAFTLRILPLYESDGTENSEREIVEDLVVSYAK